MSKCSHKRTKTVKFHLYEVPRAVKLVETVVSVSSSGNTSNQELGGVDRETYSSVDTEFSYRMMKKFWRYCDGCITV